MDSPIHKYSELDKNHVKYIIMFKKIHVLLDLQFAHKNKRNNTDE